MIAIYHSIINHLTPYFTAENAYHAAAFILAGAGAQYLVQILKVVSKNKYGKGVLRFFNGTFSTILTAVGGIATGGVSLGHLTINSAALATASVLIYRFHNSFLYKSAEADVTAVLDNTAAPAATTPPPAPKATEVPVSQFANS